MRYFFSPFYDTYFGSSHFCRKNLYIYSHINLCSNTLPHKYIEPYDFHNSTYRPHVKGIKCKWVKAKFGPKWGRIWNSYLALFPFEARELLFKLLKSIDADICEECLIYYLKESSRRTLQSLILGFDSTLLKFLHLKVLGGNDTAINLREPFKDYYKSDFGTPRVGGFDSLKVHIKDIISKIGLRIATSTFEQFVHFRDAWSQAVSSVSGKAAKIRFTNSGKSKTIRSKPKWFALYHLHDSQITEKCFDSSYVEVKPFVKPDEPAATRTVQSYDTFSLIRNTFSLIRNSYLETMIYDYNAHGSWTTMGMNHKDKSRLRAALMRDDKLIRLCTDRSSFDVNQHKEWASILSRSSLSERYVLILKLSG